MKFIFATIFIFYVFIVSIRSAKIEEFGKIKNETRIGYELVLSTALDFAYKIEKTVFFPKVNKQTKNILEK